MFFEINIDVYKAVLSTPLLYLYLLDQLLRQQNKQSKEGRGPQKGRLCCVWGGGVGVASGYSLSAIELFSH